VATAAAAAAATAAAVKEASGLQARKVDLHCSGVYAVGGFVLQTKVLAENAWAIVGQ
jgi:hypothetical protein